MEAKKIADLRRICQEWNISATGNKATLLERIKQFELQQQQQIPLKQEEDDDLNTLNHNSNNLNNNGNNKLFIEEKSRSSIASTPREESIRSDSSASTIATPRSPLLQQPQQTTSSPSPMSIVEQQKSDIKKEIPSSELEPYNIFESMTLEQAAEFFQPDSVQIIIDRKHLVTNTNINNPNNANNIFTNNNNIMNNNPAASLIGVGGVTSIHQYQQPPFSRSTGGVVPWWLENDCDTAFSAMRQPGLSEDNIITMRQSGLSEDNVITGE
ncbi:12242_t:CDS:2 [Ambispora gerdemannii]|uniref:12242_t:CDS:1 n=1 Tax=Ambispora gerdemannii TaxID=144530 RepID=A0A9N8W3J1_9GLOM|nr:12242_t:CDS:2 [Ambispora gerdemannii]